MEQAQEKEERKRNKSVSSDLLTLLMPLDPNVLTEARRLSALKGVRVEDLTTCVAQDPVLVIEFLKSANALCLSEGRPVLSSLPRAIDRLGSQAIIRLLTDLSKRPRFPQEEINSWFEIHRSRCKRTSIVARMFGEVLIKHLADECQLSGLFLFFGDMVAVSRLGEDYVELAREYQRGALNYRIFQNFKIEPSEIGLQYLRKFGIPEVLLAPVDMEASLKAERATTKTIIAAAGELIDAFDARKWERFSPGSTFPSKSALRILVLSKTQYLKIYERATEYLNAIKKYEDKLSDNEGKSPPEETDILDIQECPDGQDMLQDEIQNLLLGIMNDTEGDEEDESPSSEELQREFDLYFEQKEKAARCAEGPSKIPPPKLQTRRANDFLNAVSNMFDAVKTSEDLLTDLLEKLTFDGHFEKAAIIALSNDRKSAIIVAARGINLKHGQRMHIHDHLSPLARGFSKVQSFGNVSNENSPFGSKAFALAPLNANHRNPVALYADCGEDGSLTFEARRVFRTVVEMVNQKLVQLPGGIPIELADDY